ncbi:uncharacterized protein TNCV_1535861 [Trichonephila clavipes]|nr:uncharacterized protein TNCV_1535861 [Trichonephila clavipes]
MSFVFGEELALPAHTQEPQLLHTVPSIFEGNNALISFQDEFERELGMEPMDLRMPRLNSNRLQLAVKLPWAILYENRSSTMSFPHRFSHSKIKTKCRELWFQQDGATCHTARATIDLLKDTFGDRLISRFGPVNWPPRCCDLTPLDYFLWGYVKSLVYADKPRTLGHLEDNIRRVIADIRPQMLEKVIENWTSRFDYIRASRGSPMPEIIFKM